jgi:uncharacterized cupredoxin-like copper-binding protein
MKTFRMALAITSLLATTVIALAHDGEHFSAGQPGDPKQPARIIKITMQEDGKKMLFEPKHIDVHAGEQIRFMLENKGIENHEFMLATVAENRKHAVLMKKYPKMEHDDPNAKQLTPFSTAELLWKFTKAGTFEYACLIPGHREAGMYGTITVK